MRVGFWLLQDSIQQWTSWIAGLHYVLNCLEALISLDEESIPEVVVFLPKALEGKFHEALPVERLAWLNLVLVDESLMATSEGLRSLEAIVGRENCDVFFPVMTPPIIPLQGKIIAWIPDYQHKVHPEFFRIDDCLFRDKLFSFLTCIADRVVCSSRVVQQHLEEYYPEAAARSYVLRFTAMPPKVAMSADVDKSLKKFSIDVPYVYLPYQFWGHKNHRVAFEAWQILKSRGKNFRLICSGATVDSRNPNHFVELNSFLSDHRLQDSIDILGIVDREDQWQLYRGAKLVLQPSLFEGWSTSVEEARSIGKPILLSDISVHREQVGETGHFFSPKNAVELANLVEACWSKYPDRMTQTEENQSISAQKERVKDFGKQLLRLFADAMTEKRESISKQTLPLLAFFQFEAKARLSVIEELSKIIKQSEASESHATPTVSMPAVEEEVSPSSDKRNVMKELRAWLTRKLG